VGQFLYTHTHTHKYTHARTQADGFLQLSPSAVPRRAHPAPIEPTGGRDEGMKTRTGGGDHRFRVSAAPCGASLLKHMAFHDILSIHMHLSNPAPYLCTLSSPLGGQAALLLLFSSSPFISRYQLSSEPGVHSLSIFEKDTSFLSSPLRLTSPLASGDRG